MPRVRYQDIAFKQSSLVMIRQANEIIAEYEQQGYDLTLRQLYYQFVSRDLLPNTQQSYKRLGSVINDARLAGMIDWNSITDRTRNLHSLSHWGGPEEMVRACSQQFLVDRWIDQDFRPEVWVEKEALAGVFERVCDELDVPMFACRGYTSQSEMWSAAMRLQRHAKRGQTPVILHFGDHDPSGIDMTRDIKDRLRLFMGGLKVDRLALNMEQVEQYSPPPNPAKITDSRADAYIAEYGDESWELDALDPVTLSDLVRNAIDGMIDRDKWDARQEEQDEGRRLLTEVADNWEDLTGPL